MSAVLEHLNASCTLSVLGDWNSNLDLEPAAGTPQNSKLKTGNSKLKTCSSLETHVRNILSN